MDSLFKTSLIGYPKKAVDEAVNAFNRRLQSRVEEVQNLIITANSENSDLLARNRLMPDKVDEARTSTMLLMEYQDNMRIIIEELKLSMEAANQRKLSEIEVFRCDIQEQIEWLDDRIAKIREQVYDLLRSLSFVEESLEKISEEEKAAKIEINTAMDRFKERANADAEADITTGKYSENKSNLEKTVQYCEPVLHEAATAADESTAGLRIENITQADIIRANKFMGKMRHTWNREGVLNAKPENKEVINEKDTATSELRARLFQVIAGS